MSDHITGRIEFAQPEKLNEQFAILRRNIGDSLVIKRFGDLVQFSTSKDDYIVEMTIQPDTGDNEKAFTYERWDDDIITTFGKEALKFIGKLKKGDTLVIEMVEIDHNRHNVRFTINGASREWDADVYEPREHSEWAYGIDAWLESDIRREAAADTTTTPFYFVGSAHREGKVYENFGKRLKRGLKVAGKNEPRMFLNGTGIILDPKGKPAVVNTDGHVIYVTHHHFSKTNTQVSITSEPPDNLKIFLGNKATKALGEILTNKTLFATTITRVPISEQFSGLVHFAGIERISEEKETGFYSPLAFKCTMIKPKEINGASVFSFTSPTPLVTHFRFLVRETSSLVYPDMTELFEKSLTLTAEEHDMSARIKKAALEHIIERLDNSDIVCILAKSADPWEYGVLQIETRSREDFSVLNSYEFFGSADWKYNAWPEDKKINMSVAVLRKILSVIETTHVIITPILKEGMLTFHVTDGKFEKGFCDIDIAAMPVRM